MAIFGSLRRSLAVAIALVGALAFGTSALAQGLYYKELHKDNRIYVFNDADLASRFETSGEIEEPLTREGIGPKGETVVADSAKALQLFFFKHGISEVVEEKAPPTQRVSWKNGKTTFTLGDSFSLGMSTRIQVRYTHFFPDGEVQLPGTGNPGDSVGSFRIRRGKFKLAGWFYEPWMTYAFQANFPGVISSNRGALLEDAYLNLDLSKGDRSFMVKLGQFKVPFGNQALSSSGSLQLVDRTVPIAEILHGRDIGLQVWGQFANKLEYRAGFFNGAGLTRKVNDNDQFQYNAYLRFQPNGAVAMGKDSSALLSESDFETAKLGKPIYAFGFAYEHNSTENTTSDLFKNQKTDLFVADAFFKYRGFSFIADYGWGTLKSQDATERDVSVWFVQGGYFLKKDTWEIAGRYSERDLDILVDILSVEKLKELTGGINYYYNKHKFKAQADFSRIETEGGGSPTVNHELRVQVQFVF